MSGRKIRADAGSKQGAASRCRTERTSVLEGLSHIAEEAPRPRDKRKRAIDDSDGKQVDGGGENLGDKLRRRQGATETQGGSPLWACPFWKHDPLRNVACSSYTLKRLRDVKQHLLRKHHQPCLYCPTCRREFTTTDQRDHHIIERKCCATDLASGPAASVTHISPEKEERLRARMIGHDRDIWYRIWRILFDDATKPPSPHQGNIIEEVAGVLRVFWDQHHREIISNVTSGLGDPELKIVQEHLPRLMSTALGDLVGRLTQLTLNANASDSMPSSPPSSPGSSNVPTSDSNMADLPEFSRNSTLPFSLDSLETDTIGTGGASEDGLGSWFSDDLDTFLVFPDHLHVPHFEPTSFMSPDVGIAALSDSDPRWSSSTVYWSCTDLPKEGV